MHKLKLIEKREQKVGKKELLIEKKFVQKKIIENTPYLQKNQVEKLSIK
ncbi:MAG: hypothetical protein ISR65_01570 [Bacteriovoracaceae bacterium]|nr:hypothetical protein [Bacteriovoracaceae bacterium]